MGSLNLPTSAELGLSSVIYLWTSLDLIWSRYDYQALLSEDQCLVNDIWQCSQSWQNFIDAKYISIAEPKDLNLSPYIDIDFMPRRFYPV